MIIRFLILPYVSHLRSVNICSNCSELIIQLMHFKINMLFEHSFLL
nr:MAG TPA: hypothetical protein [Caudoviricetes sp.]